MAPLANPDLLPDFRDEGAALLLLSTAALPLPLETGSELDAFPVEETAAEVEAEERGGGLETFLPEVEVEPPFFPPPPLPLEVEPGRTTDEASAPTSTSSPTPSNFNWYERWYLEQLHCAHTEQRHSEQYDVKPPTRANVRRHSSQAMK